MTEAVSAAASRPGCAASAASDRRVPASIDARAAPSSARCAVPSTVTASNVRPPANASSVPPSDATHVVSAVGDTSSVPTSSPRGRSRSCVPGSPTATTVLSLGASSGATGGTNAPRSIRHHRCRRPAGSASVPAWRNTFSAPASTSRAVSDASSANGRVAS